MRLIGGVGPVVTRRDGRAFLLRKTAAGPSRWAFDASEWALSVTGTTVRLSVSAVARTFDDVEYQVDGGAWISTGIAAVPGFVDLTGLDLPAEIRIRPVVDGVDGWASAAKTAAGVAPYWLAQPGFSQADAEVGDRVYIYMGVAGGTSTVSLHVSLLRLDGVSILGDLEEDGSILLDANGTLELEVTASNDYGDAVSNRITITVAPAPEPVDWDVDLVGTSIIVNAMPPLPAAPVPPVFGWVDGDLIITG